MSPSATPATRSEGPCHQVPRLRRKVKVDVTKCHACHGPCRQVPRLPRKEPRRPREPSAPPEPAQCHKCHTCHAKCTSMSPSATPATRNEGRCHQVPRLRREVKVDVTKCHACHAKCGDKLCVSKLCVSKLCVSKLCVSKLCGDKLCVRKLCNPPLVMGGKRFGYIRIYQDQPISDQRSPKVSWMRNTTSPFKCV